MTLDISCDLIATARRREEFDIYLRDKFLDGHRFKCSSYGACLHSSMKQYFYPAQSPSLGSHYDLRIAGVDTRIVIVGMDYGSQDVGVSLDERTTIISQCRSDAYGCGNPHMKGTAILLKLLLGRDPSDTDAEMLGIDGVSIFDAFALVNSVMCTSMTRGTDHDGEGSGKGGTTEIMYLNCARHLKCIFDILDPTVLIIQGVNPKMNRSVFDALGAGDTSIRGHQSILFNGHWLDLLTLFIPPPAMHMDIGATLRTGGMFKIAFGLQLAA